MVAVLSGAGYWSTKPGVAVLSAAGVGETSPGAAVLSGAGIGTSPVAGVSSGAGFMAPQPSRRSLLPDWTWTVHLSSRFCSARLWRQDTGHLDLQSSMIAFAS